MLRALRAGRGRPQERHGEHPALRRGDHPRQHGGPGGRDAERGGGGGAGAEGAVQRRVYRGEGLVLGDEFYEDRHLGDDGGVLFLFDRESGECAGCAIGNWGIYHGLCIRCCKGFSSSAAMAETMAGAVAAKGTVVLQTDWYVKVWACLTI